LDGSSYRYVVQPIDRLRTSLVGLVPHAEIDRPWIKTRNVFVLLIAFLAVLLAALSFLLAVLLIRKILKIVGGVRKIQNGHFQVRIPVKGEDEIDLLALSINSMAGQIDELINRVYKSQVSQKEAELKALQAQINPHFLFNTLETLRMMAETGRQPKLSDAIAALGGIMRYNISNVKEPVTLETEIEHIHDYAEIQNLLYNGRVAVDSFVPDSAREFRIPNLLLQPVVENSVVHGLKGFGGDLRVEIVVEELPGPGVRILIRDNGSGIDAARLARIRERLAREPDRRQQGQVYASSEPHGDTGRSGGVGLENVRDRIRFFFGEASTMEVESELGGGTTVTLVLREGTAI